MNQDKPKRDDLKVFISLRDSVCGECKEELGRRAWITLTEAKGTLCLACADLDHLVFLPAGDAALTLRARKHSALSAVDCSIIFILPILRYLSRSLVFLPETIVCLILTSPDLTLMNGWPFWRPTEA